MADEVLVDFDTLEEVATTLGACYVYLNAQDMAESQRRMRGGIAPSALTKEVQGTLDKVETLNARFVLMQRRLQTQEDRPIPDEPNPEQLCEIDDHVFADDGFCYYCGVSEEDVKENRERLASADPDADGEN